MKHLALIAVAVALCVPSLAQPNPGGPVQLRNPHRGGGGFGGGGNFSGGGISGFDGGGRTGAMPWLEDMPPAPAPAPPPVSIIADGPYLFIVRGDTLMQFDKKTLKLLNSVELPRPAPPANAPAQDELKSYTAPPFRPGTRFKIGPSF